MGKAIFVIFLTLATSAFAATPTITLQGRITKPDGTAFAGSTQFRVQVLSPVEQCVLYDETQTKTLADGLFTLSLNDDSLTSDPTNNYRNDTNSWSFQQALSNKFSFAVPASKCASGSGTVMFTPSATDERKVLVQFKDSTMSTWDSLPVAALTHSASAIDSVQVGGFASGSLLRVEDSGIPGAATSFTSADFVELKKLIAGTSTQYSPVAPTAAVSYNGQRITNVGTPTSSTDATTKGYVDSNLAATALDTTGIAALTNTVADQGKVLSWDGLKWKAVTAASQWANQTGGAISYTAGNVGIGTTAPNLNGNIDGRAYLTIKGSSQAGVVELTQANADGAGNRIGLINFSDSNQSVADKRSALISSTTKGSVANNLGGTIDFFTRADGGSSPVQRAVIDSTGNVGIGTTSPSASLHVKLVGATNGQIATESSGSAATSGIDFMQVGTRSGFVGIRGTGSSAPTPATGYTMYVWNDQFQPLIFGTNATERLRLDSVGNVGIGTTSPTALLHTKDSTFKTANYTGVLHAVSNASSAASLNKIGMDIESTGFWTGSGSTNTGLLVNATGGTTNYAAVFTGGNVGIGTTAPGSALDVVGNAQLRGVTIIGSGGSIQPTLARDSTTGGLIVGSQGSGANGDFIYQGNGGTERFRIVGTGNVGIGTTSPLTKLEVAGTLKVGNGAEVCSAATYAGMIRYNSPNIEYCNGTSWQVMSSGTSGVTNTAGISSSGSITLTPGAANSVVISNAQDSSGTSSGALVVGGGIGASGNIYASGSLNGASVAAPLSYVPQLYGSSTTGNLKIDGNQTGTGNVLLATNGGKVGIGTTSPAYPLDVVGDINITGSNYYRVGNVGLFGYSGGAVQFRAGSGTPLKLTVNGTTDAVYVNSSGSVGIGTTAPGAKLDIAGAQRIISSSGAGLLMGYDTATASGMPVMGKTPMLGLVGDGSANDNPNIGLVQLNLSGANYQSAAEVYLAGTRATAVSAIGTAPVQNGDYLGAIGFFGDDGNNLRTRGAAVQGFVDTSAIAVSTGVMPTRLNLITSSNAPITFGTNVGAISTPNLTNERMRITGSGNVGIGTTSPSYLLDVNGTMRHGAVSITGLATGLVNSSTVYASPGSTASPSGTAFKTNNNSTADGVSTNFVMSATNAAATLQSAYFGAVTQTAGYAPAIVLGQQTASAVYTERMRIDGSGNVGIGTTSPAAPLHVYKATATDGNIQVDSNGSTSTAGIDFASGGSRKGFVGHRGTGSSSPTPALGMTFYLWNDQASPMILGTSGAERMRVDSAGNVGIGTTSPSQTLDVNGTARFSTISLASNTINSESGPIQLKRQAGAAAASLAFFDSTNTSVARITTFTTGGLGFQDGTGATEYMRIAAGNVGIGTTSPGAKLEVNSGAFGAATGINISTTTAGANTYEQYKANGAVIGSISSASGTNVAFNTTSDIRLKGGFKPVLSPLKQLNQIEVTNFYYLADPAHQRMDGFKAQQLYTVAPYAVTKPEKDVDKDGKLVPWLADYSKLVPLVTAAVQELYREVFGLKSDVATLKSQSSVQSRYLASVQARAAKIEAENLELKQENATMKARLDKIEKMLNTK